VIGSVTFAAGLAAFWLTPFVPALAFLAAAPLGYVLYEIAGRYRPRAALPLLAAALTGPVASRSRSSGSVEYTSTSLRASTSFCCAIPARGPSIAPPREGTGRRGSYT